MTEPTDAELDELRQANSGRLNFVTFSEFRTIARAVLAKWGTTKKEPQVGCEGSDGLLRIHAESETCDVCRAHAQAQAGAVPFTKAQRERLFQNRRLASEKNMGVKLTAAEWHRIVRYIETAHGITGGQHGTE